MSSSPEEKTVRVDSKGILLWAVTVISHGVVETGFTGIAAVPLISVNAAAWKPFSCMMQTRAFSTGTLPVETLTFTLPCSGVSHQFQNVAPGKYRLYGILAFSTTTLRWFEPIVVKCGVQNSFRKAGVQNSFCKGGDRPTVYLTRDNIMNPYWTELNWWSFMNLDFSKHH